MSSLGYASRLSEYSNKGICGLPEHIDTKRILNNKMKVLTDWIQTSNHFVILTGAGISTSAGIPDFRGPKGVWTMEKSSQQQQQQKKKKGNDSSSISSSSSNDPTATTNNGRGKKRQKTATTITTNKSSSSSPSSPSTSSSDANTTTNKKKETSTTSVSMDFSKANPTLTHRAITKLANSGTLNFVITQNVDGLHCRSGLSRSQHSILHGCAFTEKCSKCQLEYYRDYDVGGMSFQPTGRYCTKTKNCNGPLHDTLLDWDDELPEHDLQRAEHECQKADLVLCLGTSLRIEPAGSLPTLAKRYVIVNLQVTPKDNNANLIIRAKVDDVMNDLMIRLGYPNDWDTNHDDDEFPPKIERNWKAFTTTTSTDNR